MITYKIVLCSVKVVDTTIFLLEHLRELISLFIRNHSEKRNCFDMSGIKLIYQSLGVNLDSAIPAIFMKVLNSGQDNCCLFLCFSIITKCKNYFQTSQANGRAFA